MIRNRDIRLYPSNSIKYLAVRIDRFLHWHGEVNSIAVELNRANALLLKIRNFVNMETLRNIYFAIFDSHLSYSCIVWAQNVNTMSRLISLEESTSNNEFQGPIISFKPTFVNKLNSFENKTNIQEYPPNQR